MRWRTRWLIPMMAEGLVACTDPGNVVPRGNGTEAPVGIGSQDDSRLQAMAECAALMRASEELVDQVARTKTGAEQSQLTMEMSFRGGRARLLRLDSMGLATRHGTNAARIDSVIFSRAASIVGARVNQSLEQYTDRIRGEADRCYDQIY